MGRHSSLIALGTVRVRELFAGSRRRPGSAAPARRVVSSARSLSGVLPAAARPDARSAFCAGCAAVTTSNWKHAVVLTMNDVATAACYSG
ncbi:hypothetical protein [Nocardia gipuzkoensis]|uniref:hypothetical protein n=1 Tax=Nocardia gipuzkoensis TaxID=2749991 RepID=UPI00237D5C65|nr:hypothetical protein [Nocardia gipuzkoensis]MDE1673241.1 hypothetical protein [Nocardia gipuzkoensis]